MKTLKEAAKIRFKEEVVRDLSKKVKENKDIQGIVDIWYLSVILINPHEILYMALIRGILIGMEMEKQELREESIL